jgi:predicted flap endonuclease-1-like 5' DNA nuclease
LTAWLFSVWVLQRRRQEDSAIVAELEPVLESAEARAEEVQPQDRGHQAPAGEAVDYVGALEEAEAKLKAYSEQVLALGLELEAERRQKSGRDLPAGMPVLRVRVPDEGLKVSEGRPEAYELEAGTPEAGAELLADDEGPAETAASEAALAALPEPDDLARISGIGPKVSEVLQRAGITTFAQLAETSVERLQDILEQAGPRYSLADPTTWPEQARSEASADQG